MMHKRFQQEKSSSSRACSLILRQLHTTSCSKQGEERGEIYYFTPINSTIVAAANSAHLCHQIPFSALLFYEYYNVDPEDYSFFCCSLIA